MTGTLRTGEGPQTGTGGAGPAALEISVLRVSERLAHAQRQTRDGSKSIKMVKCNQRTGSAGTLTHATGASNQVQTTVLNLMSNADHGCAAAARRHARERGA